MDPPLDLNLQRKRILFEFLLHCRVSWCGMCRPLGVSVMVLLGIGVLDGGTWAFRNVDTLHLTHKNTLCK